MSTVARSRVTCLARLGLSDAIGTCYSVQAVTFELALLSCRRQLSPVPVHRLIAPTVSRRKVVQILRCGFQFDMPGRQPDVKKEVQQDFALRTAVFVSREQRESDGPCVI